MSELAAQSLSHQDLQTLIPLTAQLCSAFDTIKHRKRIYDLVVGRITRRLIASDARDAAAPKEPVQLRRQVIKGGKIIFNNGQSVINCSIQDLSEGGATLLRSSCRMFSSFR